MSKQQETSTPVAPEELSKQDGKKPMVEDLSNQQETSTPVAQEQPVNRDGTQEELSNQERRTTIVAELSKINLNQENININKGGRPQALVQPEPPLYSLLGEDINTDNSKIYRAAIRNDWVPAKDIFVRANEKLKVKLSPAGDTALHIAVGTNSSHDFVKKIVEMIIEKFGKEGLHTRNRYGDTALHIAARVGNREAAELLVREDPQMLELTNTKNHMPIWLAAWGNDVETLHYLLWVTIKPDIELNRQGFCSQPKDDSKFLFVCIRSDHYDVALYLIKKYPQLVWEDCGSGTPLETLASKPDSFGSGLCLRYSEYYWFYEFIYSCIPISADDESLSYKMPVKREATENGANNDVQSSDTATPPTAVSVWKVYLLRILRILVARGFKKVKCIIKEVHEEKLKHRRADLLVAGICSTLLEKPPSDKINVYGDVLVPAICAAIKNGCIELLEKCIEEYPGAIWCTGSNYSFFALAIKHRQEKVFNLIYQMSAYKIHMLNHRENLQNGLHAAGELPSYNRLNTVTGPALQLQRELLWFQKVEEFSEISSLHFRNKNDMTPKMLFTEQHKDLLREAQEWTDQGDNSIVHCCSSPHCDNNIRSHLYCTRGV